MADRRVAEAMERVRRGERVGRREKKVAYNGADGLPIREQIVAEHGTAVITRNAYGAQCLNTPDVLFADVDFDGPEAPWLAPVGCLSSLLVAFVVGLVTHAPEIGLAVGFGLVILILLVARGARRVRVAWAGGAEALALRRVRAFVARHPSWRVRAYRTPAGMRLLALHRPLAPSDAEVAAFFAAIAADPQYVRMCVLQRCYRARLTAKPWRIGTEGHLKPRPGVWPVREARRAEREAWLARYDAEAAKYAACRFVGTIGEGAIDAHCDAVRALHDTASGAESDRPLA